MGLMDDAENLLIDQAKREAEERRYQDTRRQPWSDDWTRELAGLLSRRHTPLSAVYVSVSVSRSGPGQVTNTTFWGEAWALRGWRPNSEWGPRAVDVLLDPSGALWTVPGMGRFIALRRSGADFVQDGSGQLATFTGVLGTHAHRFLLAPYHPENAPDTNRTEVGVPIAAALYSEPQYADGGWLLGVKF